MVPRKWGGFFSLGKSMEIRSVLHPQKLTNIWVNKSERMLMMGDEISSSGSY